MKKSIYLVILLAFLLRMGLGITAFILLPQVGFESKPQQAGYLFFDAYRRDLQAWELAQSGKPLARAFDQKYASDQYGGMLWISAFIYRFFGAGNHQPLLIIFLAALVGSLGVIPVFMSAKRLMDEKSALLSAMIFAFFPEAILQGASQMREPFLMTLVALAFYGIVEWQAAREKTRNVLKNKLPWLWMALALAGMLFISPGFVIVTLIACAGWLYFAEFQDGNDSVHKIPWQAIAAAAAIFVLALVVVAASWDSLVTAKGSGIFGIIGSWTRDTAKWNAHILERSSGIVQVLFQTLPPALAMPFVAVYGVLQPVLPAAVFEPTIPFWQILGIIRALGWYILLPLLAFAPFSTKFFPANERRRQWLWLSIVVWGWILTAAVRAGGDQWDNPRYRVILLIWMAMLAGQSFYQVKSAAGRWFWRIVVVETIILLTFGHWYAWRYIGFGFNIGIRNSLVIAIVLSVLVVVCDWLWQRFKPASRL